MTMAEKNVLTQMQSIEQRLTPLQVQYVRMLEMTGPEVEDAARRTLDENPALEAEVRDDDIRRPDDEFGETAEELRRADYGDPDEIPSYRLEAPRRGTSDMPYRPDVSDAAETLIDTLREQMRHATDDTRTLAIADYIIGNLDSNGYLQRSPDDIADDITMYGDPADVTTAEVRSVLDTVRSLDPAGVAAYDLRDCLLLQLHRLDRTREDVRLATDIIERYFDMFSKRHFDALRSAMHINTGQLSGALDIIHRLNPKPAAGYARTGGDDLGATIAPDFSVERSDDGILTVTLLNRVPSLVVSQSFTDSAIRGVRRAVSGEMTFIKRKRDEATNFIRALEMRNSTMFRVMSAIVQLQRPFFETGDPGEIRPMLLKDVAAVTGDDVSTVSRASSNKYVQTDTGIYPLKIFFNERAATANDDDDVSTRAILDKLSELIEGEDKHHPLSDETLTRALNDAGYNIARRTVTKYRERLRLPVARLRRQL